MNARRKTNIVVTAMLLLAVIVSACSAPLPENQIQTAIANTQSAVDNTPMLQSHEIVETAIQQTYVAQTGQPPAATPTRVFTATPAAKLPTIAPTSTPRVLPTATVVLASDEATVYDTVTTACEGGAPYVQIGPVTIPCDQKVLPAPASYTDAPAGYQTGDVTTDDECMTDGEMFAAHGFSANGIKAVFTGQNIVWDSCKWNLQAVGIGTYWQPFLVNMEYTVAEANGKVSVNKGPGGKWVYGATVRQLDAMTDPAEYWVHDDVVLMAREFNFGYGRDPRYGTVPGVNLHLRGEWNQPNIKATCPANAVQAAAMLGGDDPKFWTAPTWERGAWKFNSIGDGFHHFTWTGGSDAFFTVWTAENGVIDVTAVNKSIFTKKNLEEGSYHCVPE